MNGSPILSVVLPAVASLTVFYAQVRYTPPCSDGPICEAISDAAEEYGVSYARLECLAFRESSYNPYATNGRYSGLFQFDAPTWRITPYADASPFEPYAAAHAAAFLIARGESSRWPVWRFC